MQRLREHTVLPGFGMSLGYTVSYLSLIVLIPLAALVAKGTGQPWAEFSAAVLIRARWRLGGLPSARRSWRR